MSKPDSHILSVPTVPSLEEQADAYRVDDTEDTSPVNLTEEPPTIGSSLPALKPIDIGEFLTLQLPERKTILSPWLPSSGLAMLYAPRGIGKTWMALAIGYACASGGEFMGWRAETPVRVLYLDGEMPAVALQERLTTIVMSSEERVYPGHFTILTPDLMECPMPDISSHLGQIALEPLTDNADLVIVDNIATLCRSGKENEGDSWLLVQAWALNLRRQGKSVLFIHHAGKNNQQRGTSRREDVLDTVIALKTSKSDEDAQGARFELHFEKNRGFYGEDASPREIDLISHPNGLISWKWQPLKESTYTRVVQMLNEGMKQIDISIELGINKSTVNRYAKRAEEDGLWTRSKHPKSED